MISLEISPSKRTQKNQSTPIPAAITPSINNIIPHSSLAAYMQDDFELAKTVKFVKAKVGTLPKAFT